MTLYNITLHYFTFIAYAMLEHVSRIFGTISEGKGPGPWYSIDTYVAPRREPCLRTSMDPPDSSSHPAPPTPSGLFKAIALRRAMGGEPVGHIGLILTVGTTTCPTR